MQVTNTCEAGKECVEHKLYGVSQIVKLYTAQNHVTGMWIQQVKVKVLMESPRVGAGVLFQSTVYSPA